HGAFEEQDGRSRTRHPKVQVEDCNASIAKESDVDASTATPTQLGRPRYDGVPDLTGGAIRRYITEPVAVVTAIGERDLLGRAEMPDLAVRQHRKAEAQVALHRQQVLQDDGLAAREGRRRTREVRRIATNKNVGAAAARIRRRGFYDTGEACTRRLAQQVSRGQQHARRYPFGGH